MGPGGPGGQEVREEGSALVLDQEAWAAGVQEQVVLGELEVRGSFRGLVYSDQEGSSAGASMACAAWFLHASTARVVAGSYKTALVALADHTDLLVGHSNIVSLGGTDALALLVIQLSGVITHLGCRKGKRFKSNSYYRQTAKRKSKWNSTAQ